MADKAVTAFIRHAGKALKETQVVAAYTKLLGIDDLVCPFSTDGYHNGTLYEFKHDWDMTNKLANGLAQCCTSLHAWMRDGVDKHKVYSLPVRAAVCDCNEAAVVPVSWLLLYLEQARDWTRPPSSPDHGLICELRRDLVSSNFGRIYNMTVESEIEAFIQAIQRPEEAIPIQITSKNFTDIFLEWKSRFFPEPLSAHNLAAAYLCDLRKEGSYRAGRGGVIFLVGGKEAIAHTTEVEHARFWQSYKRPPTAEEMQKIIAASDQLLVIQQRRKSGEFFTPPEWAAHGHTSLKQCLPELYDRYTWWDPCCGTANLTYDCPPMPGQLFLSTLEQTDVEEIKSSGQNPGACLFQFDFLNDSDEKLPEALKKVLADKNSPLLFMVNPPWARGTGGRQVKHGEEVRAKMASTWLQPQMQKAGLKRTALQNLYTQVLYRIAGYCADRKAVVVCYTKAVWPRSQGFSSFSKWWLERFVPLEVGAFNAKVFQGTSGGWPALYSVWRTR